MNPKSEHDNEQLQVIFLPFLAPGHMTPMVDIARLFASQGVRATIVTTPTNVTRFQNTVTRDIESGHQIRFITVSLPLKEVGLPEGCENIVSAPTPETTFKFIRAIEMLQPELEEILMESDTDCIVSDILYPWTVDVASKRKIPRLEFSGSGFFNSCVSHCIQRYRPHDGVESDNQDFTVPNLPGGVVLTRSQLPDYVRGKTAFDELFARLREAERKSFGVIMNSFYELEPDYADFYRTEIGIKSWHIGPLSLFNRSMDDKAERGDRTAIDTEKCLKWLDFKKTRSVLYICFGSLTRFTKPQIVEMASALEDSGHPFIWILGKVLKTEKDQTQEEEWWLPDGFEEKMTRTGKALTIRGWAPQVLILEHPAIGGFLTHCGWNSILEGVSTGVPLITWPVFAEQFYNEKLVTQVMKIGVEVGNLVWKAWATEESKFIEKEKLMKAISRVMDEGEEGEKIRKKVKELSVLANKALEGGGSSYKDMNTLIEEIRFYKIERL